jgi:hypothetical protein
VDRREGRRLGEERDDDDSGEDEAAGELAHEDVLSEPRPARITGPTQKVRPEGGGAPGGETTDDHGLTRTNRDSDEVTAELPLPCP